MKKILLSVLLAAALLPARAQTEKGRFAISGNTNLSFLAVNTKTLTDSVKTGEVKARSFNANPSVAYFVANDLAIGVSGSFQYDRTLTPAGTTPGYLHSWSAGVLPAVTYFIPVSGLVKPTLGIGAGYLWVFDGDADLQGLTLNGKAGVSFFVNKNVSLDLGLQYANNRLKDNRRQQVRYHENGVGALFGASIFF
ncbi:outer membrane beta-barrel protein [Niabella hirudinis]|uniref:outer membrane beta-barrel protein n=1 Tax=Niabella hirudinis TaxID=1285929 RepID=UPI003EB84E5E